MNIIKYKKNNETRYKFRAYIGIDPLTGKEIKVQKSGFISKADARDAYIELLNQGAEKPKYTFKEIYHKWFRLYKESVKKSSEMTVERHFIKHILPSLGKYKINDITIDIAQETVLYWSTKVKDYKKFVCYTKKVFEHALRLDLITKNPFDFVILPKVKVDINEPKKSKYWTKYELDLFFNIIKDELDLKWNAMFRLLAFSGMRIGEVLALAWSDIDFINNRIEVNKTISRIKGNPKNIGSTKTKSSNRIIDMDAGTISILRKWRVKQSALVDIVFTNSNYEHLIHSYPSKVLNRIIDKHNLKPMNIHGFRHTHCSLLFESGASIKEVQERLGHSDVKTTMGVYAHVSDFKKVEVVNNFAKYVNVWFLAHNKKKTL